MNDTTNLRPASNGMRLLITTQAVDLDDPVLAFFHQWLLEFSKHVESIEVICLKEGRHALPKNVTVHSLGKETGRSQFKYIGRFLRYSWILRRRYDSVFVHMNPEYLVLGGFLWRLLRKKALLWYIHPKSSWRLRIAKMFVNAIASATEKSFPLKTRKLVPVGIGIDTDFFSPGDTQRSTSDTLRVMTSARIAPVKRVECIIGAISKLVSDNVPVSFDYYGAELPRDTKYADAMRVMVPAAVPPGIWHWHGNSKLEEVRDAYRMHDVHVNATESGSFDKAVFESMACGTITVACNTALSGVLPSELMFEEDSTHSLAGVLKRISAIGPEQRSELSAQMRSIAVEHYSLSALIKRIVTILA